MANCVGPKVPNHPKLSPITKNAFQSPKAIKADKTRQCFLANIQQQQTITRLQQEVSKRKKILHEIKDYSELMCAAMQVKLIL